MEPLDIKHKIDRNGFMLAADTIYFNDWCKTLYMSIRKHAPWAHIHFHIFDATDQDREWLNKHPCTYTTEVTPEHYATDNDTAKKYWVAARYFRVPEIYTDSTLVIDLDADSIMVNPLSQETFEQDLQRSWVPTRPSSLASAVAFGRDNVRHVFAERLLDVYHNGSLRWGEDQIILNEMLAKDEIAAMDLRYTHFKFDPSAYIWTGKGDRVYKRKFQERVEAYKPLI